MHRVTLKLFSQSPPSFRCISRTPGNSRSRNPEHKNLSISFSTANDLKVADKVQVLNLKFKSLSEPIERVKRLVHYATLLPPFDEFEVRIQENRVTRCTSQLWVDVKMENNGVMRFRTDSDSKITEGFASCLIWLLDGAEAEEVLSVKTEDLVEMNVGLSNRVSSRANPWHNVFDYDAEED